MRVPSSASIDDLDLDCPRDVRNVLTVFRQSFLDPWPEARLREILECPGMHGIVLRIDDLICGCLLYQFDGEVQEIVTLGVLQDARMMGVGTMLIRRATQIGLTVSVTVVAIPEDNTAASDCFEKAGFRFSLKVPGYYGEGNDADLYRWIRPDSTKNKPRRGRKKT